MPRNRIKGEPDQRGYSREMKWHAPMGTTAPEIQNPFAQSTPSTDHTSCSPEAAPRTELEFEPGRGCGTQRSNRGSRLPRIVYRHRIGYCYEPTITMRERRTLRLIHGWGGGAPATFERERNGGDARRDGAEIPWSAGLCFAAMDGWRWRLVLSRRRSGRVV
jgi:hypothetical protein